MNLFNIADDLFYIFSLDKENMAKLQQRLAELASQECGLHTLVSLLFQSPHEHTDAHVDEVAQFVLKCLAGR